MTDSRPSILGALLYLRFTSLANRARTQLIRLRRPKYLAGAAFVVAYFWFFFFRVPPSSARTFGHASSLGLGSIDTVAIITGALALGLTVFVALLWIVPRESPGIKFSEAEIAFLFPAPVSRRALIHFKVLSLQFSSLLQSVFFALIFHHRHLTDYRGVAILLSWWGAITLINLHYLGSSLTIARLTAGGMYSARRRRFFGAALFGFLAAAAFGLWRTVPDGSLAFSTFDWVAAVFASHPLHELLWPAKLVLAPFFAQNVTTFAAAFAPVVLLLIAHYVWVVRLEVSFEEASVAAAERKAAQLEQLRATGSFRLTSTPRSGRRPPFDVSRTRWPELAFLWKNLLSIGRPWFTARVWLGAVAVLVATSVALQYSMGRSYWMAGGAIALVGVVGAFFALLYGPLITRLDLRQDLANADILRTYPLPGWRIVLGELLTPIVVLTALIWLGLLAWYLGLHGHHPPKLSVAWFSPGMRLALVGCLAVLAPWVVALQLLVPNGAVVFFPAMFRTAHTPGAGIDLMGQRMLFGFGQLFALVAVFAPAAGLAVASHFVLRGLFIVGGSFTAAQSSSGPGPLTTIVVATLTMLVVLTFEIGCGVWWLGGRFEKIDLSVETRP